MAARGWPPALARFRPPVSHTFRHRSPKGRFCEVRRMRERGSGKEATKAARGWRARKGPEGEECPAPFASAELAAGGYFVGRGWGRKWVQSDCRCSWPAILVTALKHCTTRSTSVGLRPGRVERSLRLDKVAAPAVE